MTRLQLVLAEVSLRTTICYCKLLSVTFLIFLLSDVVTELMLYGSRIDNGENKSYFNRNAMIIMYWLSTDVFAVYVVVLDCVFYIA